MSDRGTRGTAAERRDARRAARAGSSALGVAPGPNGAFSAVHGVESGVTGHDSGNGAAGGGRGPAAESRDKEPSLGGTWTDVAAALDGVADSGGMDYEVDDAADVYGDDGDDGDALDEDEDDEDDEEAEGEEDEEDEDEEDLDDVEPYRAADVPEYACSYCLVHDKACVVQCIESGKWFCNATAAGSTGSHIVHHLVRAKNSQIRLHKDSPLGDAVLECYNCGERNVFALGFVASKADALVVLLCRSCLQLGSLKDLDWDLSQWEPVLQNKAFVPWLVKEPSARSKHASRQLSAPLLARLEEAWRADPTVTLEEVELTAQEEADLERVRLRYVDGYEYQNILAPLVKVEADYDRHLCESRTLEGAQVTWKRALNGRHVAVVTLPRTDHEVRIVPGNELRLRFEAMGDKRWQGHGHVLQAMDGQVTLQMTSSKVPQDATQGFSVDFVWKSTSFDRMQTSLVTLARDESCASAYIYAALMGHQVAMEPLRAAIPRSLSAPGLPALNHSQSNAVRMVLQRPLSLIQGPPGTGKTVTSATLVYHLARQPGVRQVLVCAPSNVAVDHLTEKISQSGLRVVRLASKSREAVDSTVEHLCLHNMVTALGDRRSELGKLQRLKDSQGELSKGDEARYNRLRRRFERELIEASTVICTTCSCAADPRLRGMTFTHVLIDEATQAMEPESIIPVVRGAQQLVLVGDHCQLGPVVTSTQAAKAGLTQSLFERLVILGNRPIRLEIQYRMHPALSEFASNTFYEGTLQNGVTASQRTPAGEVFPWPAPDVPMMFWVSTHREEHSSSGSSFLNRGEASLVERAVTSFLRAGVSPEQIGVITPYQGQCAYVVSHMATAGSLPSTMYRDIEVASVDAFQGREKDYIILSCVRSNDSIGIGFLNDTRRLNVALTRARFGMVIVGNPKVLAKHPLWNGLVNHFKGSAALVEGPLNALRPSVMRFPKPKQFFHRRSYGIAALAGAGVDELLGYDSNQPEMPVNSDSLPRFPGDVPPMFVSPLFAQNPFNPYGPGTDGVGAPGGRDDGTGAGLAPGEPLTPMEMAGYAALSFGGGHGGAGRMGDTESVTGSVSTSASATHGPPGRPTLDVPQSFM